MAQRILHRFGRSGVDRDDRPLVGKALVLADAGAGFAALDGQQFDRRARDLSNINSVGHIVVRPAVEGRIRLP
jgi:hypothetical protein